MLFVPLLLVTTLLTVTNAATCASNEMDIAMCLDNSGSMGSGYSQVKTFAKDVVSKFTISDTATRVAVLKFSTSVTDTTGGFSGDNSAITATLNGNLMGGTTRTNLCIDMAKNLFASDGRPNAAKLLLIITDGAPSNQIQTETAADQARAAGIVIVGVGASMGWGGRNNIVALTSNQCPPWAGQGSSARLSSRYPSGTKDVDKCSDGLTDPPKCTSPCDDHYLETQTMADLTSIIDNVVSIACVNPGCQFNWGGWSSCSSDAQPTRTRSPVITYDPGLTPGEIGACPSQQTEPCTTAKCKAKADFLLLLDSSGSMNNCDWAAQAWFAKEFTERLPFVGSGSTATFESAQVAVVQFSSAPHMDHDLTTSRQDIINVLDCTQQTFSGTCGSAGGTCNTHSNCAGDKCCVRDDYNKPWDMDASECAYKQKSGGTNTAVAMMEAIKVLMTGRPDAKKVIILATDGDPTGDESIPDAIKQWCQRKALTLYSREDHVLCMSKYAQATTNIVTGVNIGAPFSPAASTSCYSWQFCPPAMEPLGATIVTVGINVRTSNTALNQHFTEVASDPSLYIPVTDVNGGNLDDTINSLISKSCPPVDCVCDWSKALWGQW